MLTWSSFFTRYIRHFSKKLACSPVLKKSVVKGCLGLRTLPFRQDAGYLFYPTRASSYSGIKRSKALSLKSTIGKNFRSEIRCFVVIPRVTHIVLVLILRILQSAGRNVKCNIGCQLATFRL